MKTFTQWVEQNKLDLPNLNDMPEPKKATGESTAATRAFRFGYPDAAGAVNYPDAYKTARQPDAFLQMQWRKQQKMHAPSDGAP